MKFAVIETGGKQYKIKEGDKVKIEKVKNSEDGNVVFDKVLLIAESRGNDAQKNAEVKIGTPYVKGTKIEAKAIKEGRDRKKIVFRYHSKTRYRKKKGHRQHFTEVEILRI